METSNLQELINKTGAALTDAGATRYYQRVFKQVSKQLLIYSQDMKADCFCVDLGLQFLEAHYSMAKRVSEHSWPVIYSRCINELADYQRTGQIYTMESGMELIRQLERTGLVLSKKITT